MSRDRRDREHGGSITLQTIASSGDRVREFKRAGRHSWIVRFFKLALPTFAVVVVAGYGLSLLAVSGFKSNGVSVEAVKIDTENLTMDAPKYVGFGKDGERFEVRAKEAITDLKQTAPVRLNYIDGDITQKTGVVTKLKARWGTYDQKKEVLELYESIHVDGSTGMKARLTRATIFTKENHIISNEPIYAETDTGNIRADTMDMHSKQHQVVFRNNVHVHLKGNGAANAATPSPTAAKAKQAAPLPGLTANSGQPIEVKSEQLDVDDTAKTALFRRSVIARQGDATLQSPELDVFYEGKATLGEAPAPALRQADAPAKPADDATKLRMIKARGGVILTNKDDRADGDTLDYDAKLDKATLRGNVTLTSTNERKATAKVAEFDQKADTALLLGDVIVVQGRNTMRSRRLFMDRKAGKTRLDSPALDGQPAGRINTVFYQNAAKTDPGKAAKGSEPAQSNPIFGAQFKTDPNAPVDVTSDTLDVLDTAKTAIYRGEVIAKQGDFVVRTAEMTAFYSGQAGLMSAGAAPPKTDPAKSDPAGTNAQGAQLTRIEARQKVVVTSKDGQSAVGDWADFDVKANKCVIGGRVIVSQGKSVVEGTRLVIDMTTGQSNFEQGDAGPPGQSEQKIPGIAALKSATGSTAAAVGTAISSAVSGGSVTCPPGVICSDGVIRSKQRVRAVLWPDEAKAKAKQKADEVLGTVGGTNGTAKKDKSAKTDKPASAPPGWEATSQPAVNTR